MGKRTLLIAGNWKMNGTRADGERFVSQLGGIGPRALPDRALLVCPPATLIGSMAAPLEALGVKIGAQDCHNEVRGAFTGDISAAMLCDLGCSHVIVGHSERRAMHGETDAIIQAKARAALAQDLIPIICVGETLAEREAGQAETVVRGQVAGSVPDGIDPDVLVVAYEPVWAIGTGRAATLDDIAAMHHVIRDALKAKTVDPERALILYGGSVKPANSGEILALDEVDGALIGGASLDASDFMRIADSSAT